MNELPISAITPEGWLRRQLELQRDGLTGNLQHFGYPFERKGWMELIPLKGQGCAWWPYEQTAYWIDGMARCGHLLRDAGLASRVAEQIDYTLKHADSDGYLGPRHIKKPDSMNRWAHTVFFRAMMAHHSATGDNRIPEALRRHYLSNTSPHEIDREICNLEIMAWAHAQTGDRRLVRAAETAFKRFNARAREFHVEDVTLKGLRSRKRSTMHGVSYAEMAKLPALLYMMNGDRRCLLAALNGFRKVERESMLVDGCPSGSEWLHGKDPLDCHETCDIADFTWSYGYLLMATGDATWADRIERACFNAAPGACLPDFTGSQYFSAPNQVLATGGSNHCDHGRGNARMAFWPNNDVQCCAGNVNRIMPNYVARMWMQEGPDCIAAVLYGPSRIKTTLGSHGIPVTIVEETRYPFSDSIDFCIRPDRPLRFTLKLRIPGWCRDASLTVNGVNERRPLKPGQFIELTRDWAPNDRVTLCVPGRITLTRWPKGGVALERGPLVFSLPIAERRIRAPGHASARFPFWNLLPASPWNYALECAEDGIGDSVQLVCHDVTCEPWGQTPPPLELRVPARRVRGWSLRREKGHTYTPQLPQGDALRTGLSSSSETLTLAPYGSTNLRITIFPDACVR